MQVGMYYWKTCVSGCDHVFHNIMCYGRTCVVGVHVLQVGMTCMSVQSNHLSCCEFRQLVVLFFFLP